MDTEGPGKSKKKRFIFYSRWVKEEGYPESLTKAWGTTVNGTWVYKFQRKLRCVKLASNAKLEMLGQQVGKRDWEAWIRCKRQIHQTYKDKEIFWKQKARAKEGQEQFRAIEPDWGRNVKQLFTTQNPSFNPEVLQGIPRSITPAMNQRLTRTVAEEEIKAALWEMDPNKAPDFTRRRASDAQVSITPNPKTPFYRGNVPYGLSWACPIASCHVS
ncbi:potassium channel in Arabidopsis thaliana 3 [Striga asiatica]|uniref:Potassium channel in Arabidopsis thaliana 3 n=1 Tax=Striga asiatica TaxID=4170 RepID=A0A5A7PM30_STRAF|nr:potassium channel in Arabidopsis thaliana 3 [Striga asiatica]